MSVVGRAVVSAGALFLFACSSNHAAGVAVGSDATVADDGQMPAVDGSGGGASTGSGIDDANGLSPKDGADEGGTATSREGGEAAAPPSVVADGGEAGSPMSSTLGVFTYRNDNARTGQNTNEPTLSPATVDATHFGKKFTQPIDGYGYAEPLYVPGVAVPNMGTHNLVYVATEHDSVYAFDADTEQAAVWQVSFLSAGATPVPPADTGETGDLVPEMGITSTPVIDPVSGTLYVVANTKEPGPKYVYRLHALDVATGAEKFGGPVAIQATIAGTGADNVGGMVTFDPLHDLQRPALLLSGGVVYIAFGDHGDKFSWHGWVLGYDAGSLAQKYVFCTSPDADEASIWQSGAGVAADSAGNLYAETGNGSFDAQNGGRDFGMTLLKLSPAAAVLDWFTPHNQEGLSGADIDLGSAGPLVLPDQVGPHPHLVVGSGKPGVLYLVDRDQMGHFNGAGDTQIVQTVSVKPNTAGTLAGIFATPAYWNGRVYVAAVDDNLKAFTLAASMLSPAPVSQSTQAFVFPGGTLTVSSQGTSAGIVWLLEGAGYSPTAPAILYAYDATDLTKQLYTSSDAAGGRDTAGLAVKFAVPTVFNGHVYVATQKELDVYGTLP